MDTSDYITIAIWFECNNRCRTCMLSGDYDAPSSSEYQSLVRAYSKKYSGLILSGREVTTFPGLVGYVKYARDYFSHIMIQTNARKLAES